MEVFMSDFSVPKSNTPILDELTERIRQIHTLLEHPEPGLISWTMMLHQKVNGLIEWWNEDEASK
jgi:hypothetical protein